MKKYVFLGIIFSVLLVTTYSLVNTDQNNHLQLLQTDGNELITETKKIESQINEKFLQNNFSDEILKNPQNFGVNLLDYFNEIFQNVISESSIYDLLGFSIGMVIYGIFVYHFYKFLSKRDIFSINIGEKILNVKFKSSGKKKTVAPRVIAFIATRLFLFPFVIFLWFMGYSAFMFLLVQNMPTETIFLVSSGLIIAIRISAYYNEDLSKDIAKLVPFTLLGIFLFRYSDKIVRNTCVYYSNCIIYYFSNVS